MKTKTNSMLICIMLFTILSLLSFEVFAAGSYINDEANILSSNVINKVNDNFTKLEKNTGAQVRIYTLKSLDGKNIDDVAANIANKQTSTNKNAVFVVAIKEHKNKFIAGSGLNAVFTNSELDRIAKLPNDYFKKNDFNTGILKVGEAIDQDITTKAVQTGKATVVSDGLSKTVKPKKSYTGSIIFIILLIAAIIAIIYYIKRKNENEVMEFARKNNLNYSNGKSFRSANMEETSSFKNSTDSYASSQRKFYNDEPATRVVNNTTVINNSSSRDGFIEGMLVNEMMHDHHEHNHQYEEERHYNTNGCEDTTPSYRNDDDNKKISSGDWGLSSGTSDWGDTNDSNSNNSGSSDW